MDKKSALHFLDEEIDIRYVTQGKRRKFIDFIVGEESSIEGDFKTADSRVHVEGSYVFSPDLELRITADGVWDHERTMGKREEQSRHNELAIKGGHERFYFDIEHQHEFSSYNLEAVVHTGRMDYLNALRKIRFHQNRQFTDGILIIRYSFSQRMIDFINGIKAKDNPYDLFTEIRLLWEAGIIEDFVRLGIKEQLNDVQKQLEEKIEELGLDKYPVKYETMVNPAIDFQSGESSFVPHAIAIYENPQTGVGFKIQYSPATVLDIRNPKSNYSWAVTIPSDTHRQLQDAYNRRFKTPNVDDWGYTDFDYFDGTEYAKTIERRVHYFAGNEDIFVQTFARWERALHIMKYGMPKAFGPAIFENN